MQGPLHPPQPHKIVLKPFYLAYGILWIGIYYNPYAVDWEVEEEEEKEKEKEEEEEEEEEDGEGILYIDESK